MTSLGSEALGFLCSAGLVLALGPAAIARLAAAKARQPVSGDAPASHQAKQGTPTMGGLLIVGAVVVAVGGIVIVNPIRDEVLLLLAATGTLLFAGSIGLWDDLGKARKKQNKAGLSERSKLALQVVLASVFLLFLGLREQPSVTTVLVVGGTTFDLGIWYYVLGVLYICGFGNAVNFTDGLDGLAAGTTLVVALALAVVGSALAPEIDLFYAAIGGACAGFLWFNAHPARVFMGDTGALALGMGLAAGALAAKHELLLLVVGAVYVVEIGSMMIQRYVFKWRRIRHGIDYAKTHRVFRRAPLHHHFEELGWPETQVVTRFWVLGLLAAALGLVLAPYLGPVAGSVR